MMSPRSGLLRSSTGNEAAFPSAQSLRSLVSPSDHHLVDKLQSELDALRRSTKSALEQSWEEVELLQTRVAEETQRGDRLALELEESRKREDRWKHKYDELRAEWLDGESRRASIDGGSSGNNSTNNNECPSCSGPVPRDGDNRALAGAGLLSKDGSFKNRRTSLVVAGNVLQSALNVFGGGGNTNNNGRGGRRPSECTHGSSSGGGTGTGTASDCRNVDMLKSFKVSCEDWEKFLASEEFAEEGLAELHESWPSTGNISSGSARSSGSERQQPQQGRPHQEEEEEDKDAVVADRDETISALEARLSDRDRDVDSMRADLEVVAEELERMRSTFQDKEADLMHEVDALHREVNRWKRKVKDRDGIIQKQVEWSEDCQGYIKELTAELSQMYRERDDNEQRKEGKEGVALSVEPM